MAKITPQSPAATPPSNPDAPVSAPATISAPPADLVAGSATLIAGVVGEKQPFAFGTEAEQKERAEVYALRENLDGLQRANEKKKLLEEIEKLEHGGKTPGQIKRIRAAEAVREKTFKFTKDGAQFAKYRIPEVSYKGGTLRPAGYIIDLPIDKLPGWSWEAVEPVAPVGAPAFSKVG